VDVIQHWKLNIHNERASGVVITNDQECHILGTSFHAWNYNEDQRTLVIEGSANGSVWTTLSLYGLNAGVMAGKSGSSGLFYAGAYRYVRMRLDSGYEDQDSPEGVVVWLQQFARPSVHLV